MRCFSNACFAAVILLAGTTMIGCNQTPELSIQIVPTSASTKVGKWIEIWWLENRFHVVITNTSDQRLGVWEQWCSWGWSTLSFELVTGSGEQVLVNRAPGEWSKNFPDSFMLEPGEHFVLPVNLFDGTWESAGRPLDPDQWPASGTLIAVYTTLADQYTKQHGVWVGRVSSRAATFTFDIADTVTSIPD